MNKSSELKVHSSRQAPNGKLQKAAVKALCLRSRPYYVTLHSCAFLTLTRYTARMSLIQLFEVRSGRHVTES
jgi:hypothetical protein